MHRMLSADNLSTSRGTLRPFNSIFASF